MPPGFWYPEGYVYFELQLQGLLNFTGIVYAEVREDKESYRYEKAVGDADQTVNIEKRYELVHPGGPGSQPISLGHLRLLGNYAAIYGRLGESARIIALTTFSQIFIIAFVVLMVVQFSVTRHLVRMADYANRLKPSNLEEALLLPRKRVFFREPDEIDQVACAFENFRMRLREDIRRRERAKKRLEESEARFRSLTDNLPVGVYRLSMEGQILFANPAMARMFGYKSPNEIEGIFTKELYADRKDRERVLPLYTRTPPRSAMEFRYRKKDDTLFWGSIQARPLEDQDGKLLAIDGTIEDITARKSAEETVLKRTRELESLYHLGQGAADGFSLERTFHSTIHHLQAFLETDLIVIFLQEGTNLRLKAHSQLHSPHSWDESVPHKVGQCLCGLAVQGEKPIFSSDIHSDPRCTLEECKKAGLRSYAAFPMVCRKESIGVLGIGSLTETVFSRHASYLETAAHTLAIGINDILLYRSLEKNSCRLERQILEHEKSRKSLRKSEQQFRSFFNSNPEGVLLVDFEGRIQTANQAVARITGYAPDAIQNSELIRHFTGESREKIDSLLESVRKGLLDDKLMEVEFLGAEGSPVPTAVRGWLVRGEADFPIALGLFIRDISIEKLLAAQKTALEQQLQHTRKMEAIGTLAGGIAHDFNNILGGIIGFAELAQEHAPFDVPRLSHFHLRLIEGCNRATELVEQILKFSRQKPMEMQPACITPLVKEVIQFLRAGLPSTIEIVSFLEADTDWVTADLTQLHQVLVNLCTNAYHAMKPGGGRLTVSMKTVHLDTVRRFQGLEIEPGDYLLLEIADTGCGIPAQFRERVFEPYFTTREPNEGTGLGLSVSFGIAKDHNGLIEFDSRSGKGTRFQVFLPTAEKKSETSATALSPIPQGAQERILLVDDELFFLDALREHLEHLNYNVVGFQSSMSALNSFCEHPEYFDLVITDQTMPKMTGVQLIAEMRLILPDIPIILCTGFSETVSESTAEQYGISKFIMKPVHRATLGHAVSELLNGRKPYGTNPGHR
jgi:PAS domain S-box-containing protein